MVEFVWWPQTSDRVETYVYWIIFVIGSYHVLYFVYAFLRFFYRNLFRCRKNLLKRYGAGSWVAITGATGGIGEKIGEDAAKQGFNVLLMSRSEKKLKALQGRIQKTAGNTVQIEYFILDFDQVDLATYIEKKSLEILRTYDVSCLVNSAGLDHLSNFVETDPNYGHQLLQTNITALYLLSRHFAAHFIQRKDRSGLINLGSIAGTMVMPSKASYAASKVFVDSFTRAIAFELRDKVDVLNVRPGFVSTPMTNEKPLAFDCISPESCAKGIFNALGHNYYTFAHWKHELLGEVYIWLNHYVPEYLGSWIVVQTFEAEKTRLKATWKEGMTSNLGSTRE